MYVPLDRLPDPGRRFLLVLMADGGSQVNDRRATELAACTGLTEHEIRMAWDHFQTIGLLRHHEAWDDWELTLPPSPWETRPDDQLAGMDRF